MKTKAGFLLLLFLTAGISQRGFSQFKIPPPTVLSFSIEPLKQQARVKWTVSGEDNLKEYQVWRSVDEKNWYLVWQMLAQNKPGILHYEFIDRTVSGGVNYYRLESVPTDNNKNILYYAKTDAEDLSKSIEITTDIKTGKIKLVSGEMIQTMELEFVDVLDRNYPVAYVRDSTHELTIVTGSVMHGTYYLRCYLNNERYVWKIAIF